LIRTIIILIAAAGLEVGCDALIRVGLRGRYAIMAIGALALAAYGIIVNQSRLDFGKLMGAYIAIFFATSQIVAFGWFRVVPDMKTTIGGALMLIGGAVMML
jgi:drug/metabolite transporter superfamily protein YnfA